MKRFLKLAALLRSGTGDEERPPEAYAALIVRSTGQCCDAALATVDHPILRKDRPLLPLPGCTMPSLCICRFRERRDRRIGERRFAAAVQKSTDIAQGPRFNRDRRKS